ncbi:tetratricopeptide repeat-containing sensor histidine kinase [Marinifilum sp.]|uniref:tetratricopeptide repeat-containing sensor histidine kinase n=1 Tax=Marinifilum sp. TaxID=2033137 RepID=UPI003BAA20BD
MKKIPLTLLLSLCFIFSSQANFDIQISLDSLQKNYDKAAGHNKLNALLNLSKYYWNTDPSLAIEKSKHALGIAQTLENEKSMLKAMYYLGIAYHIDNQLDNSLDYLLRAHYYSQTHNFIKESADVDVELALVYYETNKLHKTYEHTNEAFGIYKKLEDVKGIANCKNLFGLYYKGNKDYKRAEEYFESALESAKTLNKKSLINSIINDLGSMYAEMGDTEKAILTYQKDPFNKSGHANFKRGSFELELAKHYLKKAELLNAKKHLDNCYSIAIKLKSKKLFRDYYRTLADYNLKLGNQSESVIAFQKLLQFQDSIANEKLSNKIEDLDSRHAMSIKNHENQALRDENQKQQLKITRQYIIGLLILLAFILIMFMLIIRYRNNLRDNELLHLKNSLVHQHQEELIEAMKRIKISEDKLRVANDTKDKMFSLIAHDLRGAIGNISNGLRMYLGEEDLNLTEQDKEEFLQALFHSSDNAYELLENLLFWAKNQTSTLSANKQMVDASSIINSNIGLLSDLAKIKSIKLFTSKNPNIEVFVDWNMINTVLRNLISNAIKFTRKDGSVEIKSELGKYFVKISVIDDGIGMLPDQIDNIYDGKTTDGTAAEKGTGLGLTLCRDFLSKNYGKMIVSSEIDKGSTFAFIIPRRPMNQEKYLELLEKETLLSLD